MKKAKNIATCCKRAASQCGVGEIDSQGWRRASGAPHEQVYGLCASYNLGGHVVLFESTHDILQELLWHVETLFGSRFRTVCVATPTADNPHGTHGDCNVILWLPSLDSSPRFGGRIELSKQIL